MSKIRFTVLLLFAASIVANAQHSVDTKEMFSKFSRLLSQEKVYLHTDKDVYYATDTIWISGYVENSSYANEFPESNYIYVELLSEVSVKDIASWINSTDVGLDVVDRRKLRRFGNTFSGYIVVPEMSNTSRAVLRGYTYWMLNSSAEYMFYKELEIVNPMKDRFMNALKETKLNVKDVHMLFGAVPEGANKVNTNTSAKDYDVQFLPEGGSNVVGGDAVIYIKGTNSYGKGEVLKGAIVTQNGKHLASFATDSLGFGKVTIKNLPAGKLYATVTNASSRAKRVELPVSATKGVTINGDINVPDNPGAGNNGKISFKIALYGGLASKGLSAFLHNGSEIYSQIELKTPVSLFSLPLEGLSPGIHLISVVDQRGNVYAERPFAVLPYAKEEMKITTEKSVYGKREKVTVNVSIPQMMLDSCSNFSVAVTDMGIEENVEKTTIESYMLLKSELNGYIEDIDYYFNRNVSYSARMARADMLLQTQGWRYYDTESVLKGETLAPVYGKEYVQTIAGKVRGVFNISKNAYVTFYAPSINFSALGQLDSGYFVLRDVDFPEMTRFIVSATGKNGKSVSHTPILQKEYFAPLHIYPVMGEKVTYTTQYKDIVEKKYYNSSDGSHSMAFTLDPVVVTSQLFTPKNSPSPIPNRPIKRSNYRDAYAMKPYVSGYDLASYVIASFTGVRRDARDGMLVGNSGFREWRVVELYMNGIHIPINEVLATNLLQMPLSEVESLIFLNGLDASPFQPVHLHMAHYPSPILMINTVSGGRGGRTNPNIIASTPMGWQKPAKFYSPKYDYTNKWKGEDKRITLYWSPSLEVGKSGKASFSFYTTDSNSNYRIEVEGRSAAGKYHSAEKIVGRKK